MDLALRHNVTLAALLSLCAFQISFSQTPEAPKRPPGTVSGRVTIKGKPAAGVAVALRRREMGTSISVTGRSLTDSDGQYRIANVSAGSYEVRPSAPAFVVVTDPSSFASKTIFVNDGENVEGIDFALVRGGVITGRVTDAEGRPVVQQQVYMYRADAWEQRGPNQPQVFPAAGGGATDDRGIYRAFGLSAGRYKVAVGRSDDSYVGTQVQGRATYNRIFHPDTSDPARATVIEVTEGSEATGVDISLEKPVETYSLSGRIVDGEKNLPVGGLRLALERIGTGVQNYSHFGTANAQGEFSFDAVPAGKYVVSLVSQPRDEQLLESPTIEIIDGNVSGVVVRITKGASVSGVVVLDNESPRAVAKLRQLNMAGYVTPPNGVGGRSSAATLTTEGGFRVGGLPGGTFAVFLTGQGALGPSKNFMVTKLERDGVPQNGNRFEIKDGEQVTGVRVVLSYGDAVLRGSVVVENGKLPPDVRLHARLSRPGELTTPIGMTQVDSRGRFLIEGVPAGVYDVIVTVSSSSDWRIRRTVKQQVSLASGATTDVTITINASDPKSP